MYNLSFIVIAEKINKENIQKISGDKLQVAYMNYTKEALGLLVPFRKTF